jgi:hypothetical protein
MKLIATIIIILLIIQWFLSLNKYIENSTCIYQYNQIQKLKDTDFYQEELEKFNIKCHNYGKSSN